MRLLKLRTLPPAISPASSANRALGERYDSERLIAALEEEFRAKQRGMKPVAGFIPNALTAMVVAYHFVGERWDAGLPRRLGFADRAVSIKTFCLKLNR